MKELFRAKKFSQERLMIIDHCNNVISEYAAQGYDLTLRQIYYRLIALDLFPDDWRWSWVNKKWVRDINGTKNALPNYKTLGSIISDARMAGMMDWDAIVDRARIFITRNYWNGPGDIIKSCAYAFAINKWAAQPVYIEVICEKQALEGILIPVCRELEVPFTSHKGYCSQSMMYRRGKIFKELIEDNNKIVKILYFGDHDPSGLDMDRDVLERLSLFSGISFRLANRFHLVRAALTMDQIEQYNPPENPAKMTDTRAKWYIQKYGQSSWELDSLEPRVLTDLVRDFVFQHRDDILWEQALQKEDDMREELFRLARDYGEEV